MRNARIATLVALAMACLVGLIGVLSVTAWMALDHEARGRHASDDAIFPTVQAADNLLLNEQALQEAMARLLVNDVVGPERSGLHKTFAESRFEIDGAVSRLEKLPRSPEAEAAWATARQASDAYVASTEALVEAAGPYEDLLEADPPASPKALQEARTEAWKAWGTCRERFEEAKRKVIELRRTSLATLGEARVAADAVERRARVLLLVTAALSLVASALLTFLIGRVVRRAIAVLAAEAGALGGAVAEGRLSARAEPRRVRREFRPVVEGLNAVMDAFEAPVATTVERLTLLAAGEPARAIEAGWAGDFGRIEESVNDLIHVTKQRGHELDALIAAATEGRLDYRADPSPYRGANARLISSLNEMLDAIVEPLQVAASYVDRISRGDVPPPITAGWRGEFDVLKRNVNTCVTAVHGLVQDVDGLAQAAVAGRLTVRADATRHQGDFRRIVEGLNATLDGVVGPLEVAARCVEQLSRGEIPPPVPEQAGDFCRLRDNLNTCITAIHALVRDTDALAQAALEGRLGFRADPAGHQGEFRQVVVGANRTVDALLAPVVESTSVLERIAARDLTARVTGTFPGEHARAKDAVNRTAEALGSALAQVSAAVAQVSGAATQIASSSQAVASGASQQAASLEQTSTSIEAVARMIERTTGHAQDADRLAHQARGAADQGAATVDHLQEAMARIKGSAEGTSQIIRDVSDIAFQTNLLALNAAVEAARAGDAGRGFAVVAEEVRSLALRAKEAAAKTEDLIRQSVKETEKGETAARQVSGQLQEIVTGVSSVSDAVAAIATAAREQAGGIAQVSQAVAEMDRVTQQNAASAEESSSAAAELSTQATDLAALVDGFRLRGTDEAPGRGLPARHAAPALRPARA